MSFKKYAPLALALIVLPTMPALAGDAGTVVEGKLQKKTAVVRFGDLDLTQPGDVVRLRHRVKSAARRVCDDHRATDLSSRIDTRRCRDQALALAMPQLDRALAVGGEGKAVALAAITVVMPK